MKKRLAVASMCNSNLVTNQTPMCVAYGDAKFTCNGKGDEATPTTSLGNR